MTRWFTALLYALILACTALPVQAAAAVVPSTLAGDLEQGLATGDEIKQPDGALRVLGEPSHGDSGHELPELFLVAVGLLVPDRPAPQVVAEHAAEHVPSPYLKGPQRPPQTHFVRCP